MSFGGKLRSDNRWIILPKQIPWTEIEQEYMSNFSESSNAGCPPRSARIAMSALIIKERLGLTDRETVKQISENPYLQYFLGLSEYKDEPLFDASLMTHFRKRFDQETLAKISDMMVYRALEQTNNSRNDIDDKQNDSCNDDDSSNKGKLLIDATYAPADVSYPTDLNLHNEAREKNESIIDAMHVSLIGQSKKPRTYRQKARQDYLAVTKRRNTGYNKFRKAIGKQLY